MISKVRGTEERPADPIPSRHQMAFRLGLWCLLSETKTVCFFSPCRSPSDPFFRYEGLKVLNFLDYYAEMPKRAG